MRRVNLLAALSLFALGGFGFAGSVAHMSVVPNVNLAMAANEWQRGTEWVEVNQDSSAVGFGELRRRRGEAHEVLARVDGQVAGRSPGARPEDGQ
jgi:hypothetical protein